MKDVSSADAPGGAGSSSLQTRPPLTEKGIGDRPADVSRSARRTTLSLSGRALVFALVAGIVALVMMRHGIKVTPDGWAYWEGSVSMLHGNGYHYFGAGLIRSFPPLYPLLLSAAQAVFGISGATLIGTVSFLAAATTFIWSYVIFYLIQPAGRRHLAGYIAALSISLYLGARYHVLLSETLLLALLGVLVFLVLRLSRSEARHYGAVRLSAISVVLVLMLLTRNAALAFWPPIALIVLLQIRGTRIRQKLIAITTVLIPPLTWFLVGTIMGQGGSHALGLGGKYSPFEYFEQIRLGIAQDLGPSLLRINLAVLVAVAACLFVAIGRNRGDRPLTDRMLGMLLIGALSVVGLFVLFNLTQIYDTLNDRFLWHIPLIVFAVLGVSTASQRPGVWPRAALVGMLVLLLLYQGWHTRAVFEQAAKGWTRWNVTAADTIRPSYYSQGDKTIQVDKHVLVSPPDFEWLKRGDLP